MTTRPLGRPSAADREALRNEGPKRGEVIGSVLHSTYVACPSVAGAPSRSAVDGLTRERWVV